VDFLDGDATYEFRFIQQERELDDAEKEEFRAWLRLTLPVILPTLVTSADADVLQKECELLRDAIRNRGVARGWSIRPGSPLDRCATDLPFEEISEPTTTFGAEKENLGRVADRLAPEAPQLSAELGQLLCKRELQLLRVEAGCPGVSEPSITACPGLRPGLPSSTGVPDPTFCAKHGPALQLLGTPLLLDELLPTPEAVKGLEVSSTDLLRMKKAMEDSIISPMQNLLDAMDARTPEAVLPRRWSELRGMVDETRKRVRTRVIDPLQFIARAAEAAEAALSELVTAIHVTIVKDILIIGQTTVQIDTKSSPYISVDMGALLVAPALDFAGLYAGVNFYLRPVNKSSPWERQKSFGKRFSFLFGATITGVSDTEDKELQTRKGILGDNALVLGAGFRLQRHLRINGGVLIFQRRTPNPLSASWETSVAWFAAASFDVDILGLITPK
jgi:hypothetical protein